MSFVYVDESGDPGFKIGRGSTEYFVVSTVIVSDRLPVVLGLEALRETFGLPARFEFKFLSSNPARRRISFEEIRRHGISIRGFVGNKRLLIERPEFRSNAHFYGTLLQRALRECKTDLLEATITLGQFMSSRTRMRALTSSLRQALQAEVQTADGQLVRRVKEIRHTDSRTDPMLQVADMIAGAIAADRSQTDTACLEMFQARVRDILNWYGDD
jgi:hypothetical protein